MMKTAAKKGLVVILIAVLVLEFIAGGIALLAYYNHKNPKKAVIILPGLFASGLYDTATGNGVWDPLDGTDLYLTDFLSRTGLPMGVILNLFTKGDVMDTLDKLFANDYTGAPDSLFNMMAMNEDGTPVVKTVAPVPFSSDSRLRYGVLNAQKEIYDTLNAQYGAAYNVEVFNYDFRLDNRDSAEKLEKYINEQGYTEVILASHSNGGSVASCYLARSQENRDKVSLYMSYDVPYYGSFSAITILENIEGMISGMLSAIENISFLSNMADNISKVFDTQFTRLVNMWAPYQLLPSYSLLTTQQYRYTFEEQIFGEGGQSGVLTKTEQKAMINIDGEDIFFESDQDLWEFYCSRPWAKISTGAIRNPMKSWIEFQDAMTVTLADGSKVHSTSLVNTHYFSGIGYGNVSKVYYETTDDGLVLLPEQDRTDQGDGTVLLYSATAGCTDNERIHVLPYTNHYDVVQRFDAFSKDLTIAVMDKEISLWDKIVIALYK